MKPAIKIAIDFNNSQLGKTILAQTQNVPEVKTILWNGNREGKKGLTEKMVPHIIVMTDNPESGDIFGRLAGVRKSFPQAAIFVVSTDQRPQHIVEVMKAGGSEYLIAPVDTRHFRKAIAEVQTKIAESAEPIRGSVFSFISSKGGLGSTFLSVNTAAAMALNGGGRVALHDLGFQSGDSSVLLDIMPDTTIIDLCRNFNRLDTSLLRGAMIKHSSGLELLAAPLDQEDSDEIAPEQLAKILSLLARAYDKIIVDCTSMFVHGCTIQALNVSDKIFIITDLSVLAIRNAARLYSLIQKVGINPRKIEFVVNRYTRGGTLSIKAAEKNLGKNIFWLFLNQFDDVTTSINNGVPLVQKSPRCTFAKSVNDFVHKIHDPALHKNYRGVKGTFGKPI